MRNNGLFSTLFIDRVKSEVELDDTARGRMATLSHNWKNRDKSSSSALWGSFIKQALGNLTFIPGNKLSDEGLYPVHKDWTMKEYLCLVYLVEPGANLDDTSVGCFWPSKLLTSLKEKKLNWGILTDGAIWRLYTLKTAKPYEDYVELDLSVALDKDDETEYALFERFFHAESFAPEENDDESDEDRKAAKEVGLYRCRLDQDRDASEEILQEMVKTPLLVQVDEVLQYICNGFIADTNKSGEEYSEEERRDIFESAVKLLYRCMFLFYAESRKLLPSEKEKEREYRDKLSIHSICEEARKFKWNKRSDTSGYGLWNHLKGLVNAVNEGDRAYGVMGYNGGLFDDEEEVFLGKHKLRNDYLARALYLMTFVEPGIKQTEKDEYRIPFEDLEVRHLGELYENILEFNVILADADRIRRRTKDGFIILLASEAKKQTDDTIIKKGQVYFGQSANERKQTGSYYTPESLVGFLVEKSVISPLRQLFEKNYSKRVNEFLDQANKGADSKVRRGAIVEAERLITRFIENEVLKFKVCDPAMGSAHFLVSTSNRLTNLIIELFSMLPVNASIYSKQTCQPNHWRRLITRHCIYGVDLKPLAVNLGKLSLWLNCFATDHKLTFLDHRLRTGNSLIGIRTLDCLKSIPKRKKDKKKKDTEAELPNIDTFESEFEGTSKVIANLARIDEDDTDRQKSEYDAARDDLEHLTPLADLYTAYLMDDDIIPDTYQRLFQKTATGKSSSFFDEDLKTASEKVSELSKRHKFFHWPIEFPDVFNSANSAGFDATIGNPPWDVVKPNSQEFLSLYDPSFSKFDIQEVKEKAERLMIDNPNIKNEWNSYGIGFEEQGKYFKQLNTFSAVGGGDINTFKLFFEQFYLLIKESGHLGIIIPSGFYTDKGCTELRKLLFFKSSVQFLYCFENRKAIFNIHRSFKFILFSTVKGGKTNSFKCAFMQHNPERLPLIDSLALIFDFEQIKKQSPEYLNIIESNKHEEVEIVSDIYSRFEPLGKQLPNKWHAKFTREIDNMGDMSILNTNRVGVGLYEGKMIHQYNPLYSSNTYWIDEELARRKFQKQKNDSGKIHADYYRLANRRQARSTDTRTMIACIIPPSSFAFDNLAVTIPFYNDNGRTYENISYAELCFLCGIFNSFVFDFLIGMQINSNLSFFIVYSMPVPRLTSKDKYFKEIVSRVAILSCVNDAYKEFWRSIFVPVFSKPKFWYPVTKHYGLLNEQNDRKIILNNVSSLSAELNSNPLFCTRTPESDGIRSQLRSELDAYVAHLYGVKRNQFEYIIDQFIPLKNKEISSLGEFKSKRKCLEEYDRIAEEF